MTVGADRVTAALTEPGHERDREYWLRLAGSCQSLINTLTAVQDTAIAEAARRESTWCEDGTLGETVHAPGRVALDAADLVAPVLGASHAQAQRRVEHAVRLAAGRVPVPAEDRDTPQASGLDGLHQAMTAGQLDGYRAAVIAFELEVAPAHVADAIVAALGRHYGDEAATLRRRTRVLLERISPDLVRERARRARSARPGCAAGSPNPASTNGTAPSPAKTPPPPGPRSTASPTTTSRPAPARPSNKPAAKPSPTWSPATPPSTSRSSSPSPPTPIPRTPPRPASRHSPCPRRH